jgi:NADH:ubiquinone oxidoreductase subunit 6 (subunit J)
MTLRDVAFVLIALFTICAALGVVIFKNIVHSALFLVLTFLGVAGIYFHLSAGFVGVVQILVYAGAISVLIIFAIMLVMDKDVEKTNLPNPRLGSRLLGGYIILLMTLSLAGAVWFTRFPVSSQLVPRDEVGLLASLMLGRYVVPFEVAAVLLLVAVVGAIILAKGAEDK